MMRSLTRMPHLEGDRTVYLFLSLTYKYMNDLDINVLGRSTHTDSRSAIRLFFEVRKAVSLYAETPLNARKGVPKGCSVFLEA